MNLPEFIKTYEGKGVDFDGKYGNQCVDLARQYWQDVCEVPKQPPGVEGAKDFARADYTGTGLKFVPCEAQGLVAGDVVVYSSTTTNRYGHIAVVCANVGHGVHIVLEQDGFNPNGSSYFNWRTLNVLGAVRMLA